MDSRHLEFEDEYGETDGSVYSDFIPMGSRGSLCGHLEAEHGQV